MSRVVRAFALSMILTLPGAGLAVATEPTTPQTAPLAGDEPSLKGTVGVCVRWGADDNHVEEAVVVRSSGNAFLDSTIPDTLRQLVWQRPDGDDGSWLPLNVSVDGDEPTADPPSCAELEQANARPGAPPQARTVPSPVLRPAGPLPKGMHRA